MASAKIALASDNWASKISSFGIGEIFKSEGSITLIKLLSAISEEDKVLVSICKLDENKKVTADKICN